MSNIPIGTENDPDAPWNQIENPEKEIEVTVSLTISKTLKVSVSDYTIQDSGKDGDYYEDIDYSTCDLKGAVEDQYNLPIKGWNIDDFEVLKE